jgi:opacity protein-like surface antigen
MSVKKILLLGAAGVAAVSMTAALAGGFTQEPAMPVAENGYYIEAHLGYARQNYFDNTNWGGARFNSNSNASGGFAAGLDAGYKINRHFAAELGWFYLPTVNVMPTGFAASNLTSWALYLAGKYMMPLPWMNSTDMFFKLGVAYRDATLSSAAGTQYNTTSNTSTFVRPMFATGLDYSFNDTWSGVLQYAYFMGANNSFPTVSGSSLGTVAANVFTLGLAYKFTV